jgi:hypothetical protein
MEISGYSFGSVTVDGRLYRADFIILPGRILPNWRRRNGHLLTPEDLPGALTAESEILVVGTGAYGRMKLSDSLRSFLAEGDTALEALATGAAFERFALLTAAGRRAAGAFHLTC